MADEDDFDYTMFAGKMKDQGLATNTEDAQDALLRDELQIRQRMNDARARMDAQNRAADLKSHLCDEVRKIKVKRNLVDVVKAFEETDPELYNYIRQLEMINTNIWCTKCDIQKNIGKRPPPVEADDESEAKLAEIEAKMEQEKLKQAYFDAVEEQDMDEMIEEEKNNALDDALMAVMSKYSSNEFTD